LLAGRTAPEGQSLDLLATAYEYAVGGIPTELLEECFKRAVRTKRDSFPVSGQDINREYQDMQPELAQRARAQQYVTERAENICPRCKGAGKLVDRSKHISESYVSRPLEDCPQCDGKPLELVRDWTAPKLTFSEWRQKHLLVCSGCADGRFQLAHKAELAAFAGIHAGPTPPPASEFMQPVEDILF
jgi:Zn finger protein HypA/HybF involved in hydrogenase expression